MKRVGLMASAIVAVTIVAASFSSNARAASSAKEQITAVENKLISATSADEVMKYIDQNDVDFYDFAPPLQYKGATAVRGDLDNFFGNAKDVKGDRRAGRRYRR
jgi:hypothetical protein